MTFLPLLPQALIYLASVSSDVFPLWLYPWGFFTRCFTARFFSLGCIQDPVDVGIFREFDCSCVLLFRACIIIHLDLRATRPQGKISSTPHRRYRSTHCRRPIGSPLHFGGWHQCHARYVLLSSVDTLLDWIGLFSTE